jgi:hypothetical protein
MFLGYDRRYSVTQMLTKLNLFCFDSLIAEIVNNFNSGCVASINPRVDRLCASQQLLEHCAVLYVSGHFCFYLCFPVVSVVV